eukprot:366413-Chlamydomonas_euryale.AAC.12
MPPYTGYHCAPLVMPSGNSRLLTVIVVWSRAYVRARCTKVSWSGVRWTCLREPCKAKQPSRKGLSLHNRAGPGNGVHARSKGVEAGYAFLWGKGPERPKANGVHARSKGVEAGYAFLWGKGPERPKANGVHARSKGVEAGYAFLWEKGPERPKANKMFS